LLLNYSGILPPLGLADSDESVLDTLVDGIQSHRMQFYIFELKDHSQTLENPSSHMTLT